MDAKITLSATPHEFDLLRESVERHQEAALSLTKPDSGADMRAKDKARKLSFELSELLKKLR